LAFAAIIKAGLTGIKNQEVCPDAVEESVYKFDELQRKQRKIKTLPGTLGESIDAFKESKLMREFLSEEFFVKYYEAKKKEWDEYRIQVTEWEHKRYLEVA
jgi:glutamine synthetase